MIKLLTFVILFSLIGCSHLPSSKTKRELASTSPLKVFIQEIAQRTQRSSTEIEKEILDFIKKESKESANYRYLGLTKGQANNLDSLYDDLPFMGKVRNWVEHNITRIIKVDDKVASEAFDKMLKNSTRLNKNPYVALSSDSISLLNKRRSLTSPLESGYQQARNRSLKQIEELPSKYQKLYKENLLAITKRDNVTTSMKVNAVTSMDSGYVISKRTGLSAFGDKCDRFNKLANENILAAKANIDVERARLIEEMAIKKNNGKNFEDISDVAKENRLTQAEIDEATVQAFKNVNSLTDDEARAVLKRLKNEPCKVY